MYFLKKIYYTLLLVLLTLLAGCAVSNAPDNFLPETENVPQSVYGGWITVITAPDSLIADDKWLMYGGEFIASEDSVIYVMYDSIYQIPKNKIAESILELDQKNSTTYGIWVLGGSLLTLSNGVYASITLPLWLSAGIPSVVSESSRDRYEMEYPDEEFWDSVKVFSRFPQGIEGIDLRKIKPYDIIKE